MNVQLQCTTALLHPVPLHKHEQKDIIIYFTVTCVNPSVDTSNVI